MARDQVLSMLGLAARSRNVASGEFSTEKAVKSNEAVLVIVAEDASDNTKKMFQNMCDYYHVKLYLYGTKEMLGHAIGREYRASLAVCDENLAKAVENKLLATQQK